MVKKLSDLKIACRMKIEYLVLDYKEDHRYLRQISPNFRKTPSIELILSDLVKDKQTSPLF